MNKNVLTENARCALLDFREEILGFCRLVRFDYKFKDFFCDKRKV